MFEISSTGSGDSFLPLFDVFPWSGVFFSLTFEYLIFFCVAFLLHLIVWLLLVVVLECVGTLEWLVVDRLDDFCLD